MKQSGIELEKEYNDIQENLKNLEDKITKRCRALIKNFSEYEAIQGLKIKEFEPIDNFLSIKSMLAIIKYIENKNAGKSKQLELELYKK